jgi:hypothetical protein
MGISIRDVTAADGGSMRQAATDNNLPYEPFTLRELITPQYQDPAEAGGRTSWSNWVGDHDDYDGDRIRHTPTTRAELVGAVVSMAHDEKGEIRAVGSGHSHSNAPSPRYHFVDLNPGADATGLNDVLSHNDWLNDDVDERYHKRIEAGMRLRRLNRYVLYENGYALENMGSFDGQTIAGAVNTSTHGTGIDLAAISDAVASVEMAAVPASESGDPIVRMYRIEPTDGITDREAFEADTGDHETVLIQDDDIFHSVVVGYGCMGVVYAYTLNVRDKYWLKEDSTLMKWSTVKSKLGSTASSVEQFATKNDTRHLQILVNTAAVQSPSKSLPADDHQIDGDPICLVRRHYDIGFPGYAQPPDHDGRWPPERISRGFREFFKAIGNKPHPLKSNDRRAKEMHNNFFHPEAEDKPFESGYDESAFYVALRRIRDEGDGGNNYHTPEPPTPTPTCEVAVPLEQLTEAVDDVLQEVQQIDQQRAIPDKNADGQGRNVFFMIPIGLRFTDASEQFLSPEFGRKSAMVELPMPVNEGTTKATLSPNIPTLTQDELREYVVEPALGRVERMLVTDHDGRPHMGKHNNVDASELDRNYEYFDASDATGEDDPDVGWYQLYEYFNAFGTFDNEFTDQLGLDGFTPARSTDDPIATADSTADDASDATDASESADTGDSSTAGGAGTPGFGALAGAAGLGAGAWWLHHRGDLAAETTGEDRAADPDPPADDTDSLEDRS